MLREIESRERADTRDLIDDDFPEQAAFVRDSATFVTACTTRRAGKSSALAYKFFRCARKHQNIMMPYIALTRGSAENIMWPVLKEIALKEGIPAKFTDSNLTCSLANGMSIQLFGADTKGFMEKLRGIKTPMAAVDEVQSFRAHVEGLVDDILTPAVSDYPDGQLVLTGTPGPVPKGYFHSITELGQGGFSYHHWSAFNNPYIKNREFVEKLMQKKGWDWTHPTIQREWLGKWVADFDALCYKFDEQKNRASELPRHSKSEWTYVFGIDLGYDPDPTAFVIGAYNEFDPNLYIVETFKQTKMIISDVVERIKYYQKKYPGAYIVVDAADKQAVEEMKQRHGVPLVASEKHGKAGFIELMNSDMRNGLIKIVGQDNEDIVEEWQNLIWDQDSEKRIEDSRYDNHLADGALYLWRYCYNFLWQNRPKEISIHSEEKTDLWWDQQAERLSEDEQRQRELERDAFGDLGFS